MVIFGLWNTKWMLIMLRLCENDFGMFWYNSLYVYLGWLYEFKKEKMKVGYIIESMMIGWMIVWLFILKIYLKVLIMRRFYNIFNI
jgi:hypothetical protein